MKIRNDRGQFFPHLSDQCPPVKKACIRCKTEKAIGLFGNDKNYFHGKKNLCKKCESNRSNAWNKAHPKIVRKNLRRCRLKKYGLTPMTYAAMFIAQDACCAICHTDVSGSKGWTVDHDHRTGKVRGVLCGNCNTMLGHAKDDVVTLRNAITYLSKRAARKTA